MRIRHKILRQSLNFAKSAGKIRSWYSHKSGRDMAWTIHLLDGNTRQYTIKECEAFVEGLYA